MKKLHILPALIIILLLSASLACAAYVPATLSYQGSIYNIDGTPVNGVKKMYFRLFAVSSGGTAFWSETQTAVNIVNGRFATVLGNATALSPSSFTSDVWLETQVDGEGAMIPRQKMTSVAFAFNATNATNATSAASATNATAANNGVPVRGIIMWYGTMAQVPDGWALCNGQEVTLADGTKIPTPNLANRFIVAAGGTYALGATGGADSVALAASHIPRHNHAVYGYRMLRANNNEGATTDGMDNTGAEWNLHTSSGENPAFFGGNASYGTDSHENRPPYYGLFFLMRYK